MRQSGTSEKEHKSPMITTTHKQIIDYWETRIYEGNMGCDWSEAHQLCWRCAENKRGKIQRCHIIAQAAGGPDVPSNYVLLCERCHKAAPDCPDAQWMWNWIKETWEEASHSVSYQLRQTMEAIRLADLQPGDSIDLPLFNKHLGQCGLHQGYLSPASAAWCLKRSIIPRQRPLFPERGQVA